MAYVKKLMKLDRTIKSIRGFIIPHFERPVKISQGYDGPWSHTSFEVRNDYGDFLRVDDDTYSLDFELPFGTNVHAAKAGVATYVMKDSDIFYPQFNTGT